MPVFSRIEARTAVFWSSPNGCTMFFSTVLWLGLVPSKWHAVLYHCSRHTLRRVQVWTEERVHLLSKKKKFEQILKLTVTASFLQNLCLRNNSTVSRRVSFSSTSPPSQIIPFTAFTRCKCFLGSLQKSKDSKMQWHFISFWLDELNFSVG